jgi:hypothetical protein
MMQYLIQYSLSQKFAIHSQYQGSVPVVCWLYAVVREHGGWHQQDLESNCTHSITPILKYRVVDPEASIMSVASNATYGL